MIGVWYRRSSRFISDVICRHTESKLWMQKTPTKNLLRRGLLGFLGFGALTTTYYWNVERVPYTKRSHFVLFSTSLEKFFEKDIIKSIHDEGIVSPLDPLNIRVQRIGQEIVEAAQKGLKKEEEPMVVKIFKKLGRRDYHQIPPLDWEFFVVDGHARNSACCYPGGKIVLSSSQTDGTFQSDAELAGIIAHEVGHAIARHIAEKYSRLPGVVIPLLFLYWRITLHLYRRINLQLFKDLARLSFFQRKHAVKVSIFMLPLFMAAYISLLPAMALFFILLPNSRRREKEADYIGPILMALAGYDPRVCFEHWENLDYDKNVADYTRTHPSNKKRAQLLSQPKVMEEALSLYEEALRQQVVEFPTS